MPTEHGAWSWMLIPLGVGVAVSQQFDRNVWLALIGSLALFLLRRPMVVWLRTRRGQGRKADAPLAFGWAVFMGAVAISCFVALWMMGHVALIWLAILLLPLLIVYMLVVGRGSEGARTLWMELIGATGLALTAPAAHIVSVGRLRPEAWALWGLMALQNGLGVLYVRARIADTHFRPINRPALIYAHSIGAAAVIAAGALDIIPLAAAIPFLAFAIRAVWVGQQPRPIANVKRFGFTEVAIELLSGVCIIIAYRLQ